jgi:hypothetical protein
MRVPEDFFAGALTSLDCLQMSKMQSGLRTTIATRRVKWSEPTTMENLCQIQVARPFPFLQTLLQFHDD